jgi:hypothetical protein
MLRYKVLIKLCVLSCELICCVYGDTIQLEVVVCVCWLYCTELRVDWLCIWWHHPTGGGGVVCAGCTVLSWELTGYVYGDTIQVEVVVVLCMLVVLYWVASWLVIGDTIQLEVVLCLLLSLCRAASWYTMYMVTPSKWRWWCCVRKIYITWFEH